VAQQGEEQNDTAMDESKEERLPIPMTDETVGQNTEHSVLLKMSYSSGTALQHDVSGSTPRAQPMLEISTPSEPSEPPPPLLSDGDGFGDGDGYGRDDGDDGDDVDGVQQRTLRLTE
jgi:hypothetical protein